jgi:cytoskeletal protein RodZ
VAQKKRKKKTRWLRILLFVILTPLIVWSLAFVVWLYWRDDTTAVDERNRPAAPRANPPTQRSTKAPDKAPQERINEQDRRKLEEILEGRK